MKLTTTTEINGHTVDFLFTMSGTEGHRVYERVEEYGGLVTLYFINGKEEVVDIVEIKADSGLRMGYISSIKQLK